MSVSVVLSVLIIVFFFKKKTPTSKGRNLTKLFLHEPKTIEIVALKIFMAYIRSRSYLFLCVDQNQ